MSSTTMGAFSSGFNGSHATAFPNGPLRGEDLLRKEHTPEALKDNILVIQENIGQLQSMARSALDGMFVFTASATYIVSELNPSY